MRVSPSLDSAFTNSEVALTMMSHYRPQLMEDLGVQLFGAAGAPEQEARIVSHHLVESSLMGHDSHGVLRLSLIHI